MSDNKEIVENKGGYDIEPVDKLANDFYCMICLKIMRDPVQFVCGHGMCSGCYKDLLLTAQQSTVHCPQCRKPIPEGQTVLAHMINRMILSLKIKCKNAQCEWTGELSDNQDHILKCEYEQMKCTNYQCIELVKRCEMEEHLKSCAFKVDGNDAALLQRILNQLESQQAEIKQLKAKVFVQQQQIDSLKCERVANYGQPPHQLPPQPQGISADTLNQLTRRIESVEMIDPLSSGYIRTITNVGEVFQFGAQFVSETFQTSLRGYQCSICLIIKGHAKSPSAHLRFQVLRDGSSDQRHFNYKVLIGAFGGVDTVTTEFCADNFVIGMDNVLWHRDVPNFISPNKLKSIKSGGFVKLVCNFSVMS